MIGEMDASASTGLPPAASFPAPTDDVSGPWNGVTAPTTRGRSSRLIGEIVVDLGLATREVVDAAVAASRTSGRSTGRILVEDGSLTPTQLARVLAERFGMDHVDLSRFSVDPGAASLITPQSARRYEAVPVGFMADGRLLVAIADPTNVLALDDLALSTGHDVMAAVAAPEQIATLIARLEQVEATSESAEELLDLGDAELDQGTQADDAAPVVKLVHSIVAQAVEQGASDIHFDPEEKEMRVRFRIDGVIANAATVPGRMANGVISRIKVMANLDIAERRIPQDGRIALRLDGREVDLRIVTLPLVRGESVVMRILDKTGGVRRLEDIGMEGDSLARFERAFSRPYGAVLVTGPTGSGKSTTLYGALTRLATGARSIITIEDPVEYGLPGIKQLQVNPKTGVTFAKGLRSMMRADPDIIMVGEIRDRETAQIATEAALTGHLVLSTLHTRDAATAIVRLLEMDIEPFLVASAVDCVVAQRLARRLCVCKKQVTIPEVVLRESGFEVDGDIEAFEPVGCQNCTRTGYRGRVGIFEVLDVTEGIRALIARRGTVDEILAVALQNGMRTLREDALAKVIEGSISLAEAARVTVAGG